MSSADFTIYTPGIGTFSQIWSHLLWGEFSSFSEANAFHNFPIFRSTRYSLMLGRQKQYGMQSLPDTAIHDQQWESNPKSSDLKFNALSTWPHVSIFTCSFYHHEPVHKISPQSVLWYFLAMLPAGKQINRNKDRQTEKQTSQCYRKHDFICWGGDKQTDSTYTSHTCINQTASSIDLDVFFPW